MVDLTSISTTTDSYATSADRSGAKLADDFDDFLTLLTTQLQNQDPTSPMDSNEFTNQLVQFSSVEQQIRTNQNLETLGALMAMANITNAASYLGQDALIPGDTGIHNGTDGIIWRYQNTSSADKVTLEVLDDKGDVVYSQAGLTGAGLHPFSWDGTDGEGNLLDKGEYTLRAVATDDDDETSELPVAVQQTITAVDTSGTQPIFTAGPYDVNQTSILQLVSNH